MGDLMFSQFTALRLFDTCLKGQKTTQNLRKVPETQHFLAIFYSSYFPLASLPLCNTAFSLRMKAISILFQPFQQFHNKHLCMKT